MGECFVSFSSAEDVRNFVTIATQQIFHIQLESGELQTNAKSIMSIFSMGLHRPLRLVILDPDADTRPFFSAVQDFLVS